MEYMVWELQCRQNGENISTIDKKLKKNYSKFILLNHIKIYQYITSLIKSRIVQGEVTMTRNRTRPHRFDPDKPVYVSQLEYNWSNYKKKCEHDKQFYDQQQKLLQKKKKKRKNVEFWHDDFEEYIINLPITLDNSPLKFQTIHMK